MRDHIVESVQLTLPLDIECPTLSPAIRQERLVQAARDKSEEWSGDRETSRIDLANPVKDYVSDIVDPDDWPHIADAVRDICIASLPVTSYDHVVVRSLLTRYVYWAWTRGVGLTVKDLIEPMRIEYFLDTADLSEATKGNYRSILRAIGKVLIGPPAFQRPVPRTKSALNAPYSTEEIAALYSWARHRRSRIARDRLLFLMACSRGAGLKTEEICGLTVDHIEIYPEAVLIKVPGRRSREVWVDTAWHGLVAELGLRAQELMGTVGKSAVQRAKDISNLIDKQSRHEDLPKFMVRRFRAAWIVSLLDRGMSPLAVARAAGVSTDQIGQYIEFMAPFDDETYRTGLRGEP